MCNGFFLSPLSLFSVLVVKKSVLKKLTTVSILLDVCIARVDIFIAKEDMNYLNDESKYLEESQSSGRRIGHWV